MDQIDGLLQDCIISVANTLEILQYCTKPLKWNWPDSCCGDISEMLQAK